MRVNKPIVVLAAVAAAVAATARRRRVQADTAALWREATSDASR